MRLPRVSSAILLVAIALTASAAYAATTKLSQINNAGAINTSTDQCVAVRSGTTDELVTLAASAGTDTTNASNIASGTLGCPRLPALTGDVTTSSCAATVPELHGNTLTSTNWCTTDGTIINCNSAVPVTSFSAASTGLTPSTATTGAVILGGTLVIGNGGTGQTTASAAFNALSPMTTSGDIIYGGTSGAGTRLGANSSGTNKYLQSVSSGVPAWAQVAFGDLSGQATNAQLATQTANTVLGALTATTPSGLALPSCTDTSGNHLNYTSGTGFSCGTTASVAGTVTSIATGNGITGGTITSTGTLGLTSIGNNAALCNNSGSSAAPTTANCTVTGTGNMVMAASPTLSGTATVANITGVGNDYLSGGYIETGAAYTANTSTSYALNIDNGPKQVITITGAVTITLATPTHAGSATFKLLQDGSGHVYSISGCKWAGGTAITYSTAAAAYDIVSVWYDGTNSNCMGGAGFQ